MNDIVIGLILIIVSAVLTIYMKSVILIYYPRKCPNVNDIVISLKIFIISFLIFLIWTVYLKYIYIEHFDLFLSMFVSLIICFICLLISSNEAYFKRMKEHPEEIVL